MSINISDIIGLSDFIKMMCGMSIGCWLIVATLIPMIWLNKHLCIDLYSLINIPIGIVSMLLASSILVVLGLITSPLGGEPLHRCAIISASILIGVPIILSIKDALTDRAKETSVEGTGTVKSIKKEEIPGQLNMSKSTVRKIKSNQKRYKKHK